MENSDNCNRCVLAELGHELSNNMRLVLDTVVRICLPAKRFEGRLWRTGPHIVAQSL